MRKLLTLAFALLMAFPASAQELQPIGQLPSGQYKIDPTHASLTFKVKHMGLSNYTARFTKFDATIDYSKAAPETSKLKATVDAGSIRTDYPDVAKVDFDKELSGADWLDAGQFPTMTFIADGIKRTGPSTGKLTGNFTMHGVTKPVTLDVTLVGATTSQMMSKKPAMGFSATGTLKRSDFGVSKYVPMVSDDVQIIIEAEFQKAE